MRTSIKFKRRGGLIILPVIVRYRYTLECRFAFDTGAVLTVITPQVAQFLGYGKRELKPIKEVTGITGSILVSQVTLSSMKLFNYEVKKVKTTIIDLPSKIGVDGLIGLNFLDHFKMNINFKKEILTIESI